MSLMGRILTWLFPDPPVVPVAPRRRRIRATCEYCGKTIAVIASTGCLWPHTCSRPDLEGAPAPQARTTILTPEMIASVAEEPR